MSVEILKVGKWQSPINSIMTPSPHTHNDFYQLIFTQNSIGKLIVGDEAYPFKPEHVYITPPGVLHTCANTKSTQYVIFYFKTLNPVLDEILKELPSEIYPRDIVSCKQLLSQSAYEFSIGTQFSHLRANAYLELFLSSALDAAPILFSAATEGDQPVSAMSDTEIDRVANFIYNNFSKEISVEDLVAVSNFERRHFYRVFKEKFGTTPNKYINELRLNKAKTLLATTNMPVNEIAAYCGFSTEHYFSRVFSNAVGVSPSEYRKATERSSKEIVF
ncbi:MAG: helix-turn-helix domain-containing protein [Oscillospiraceae bacterium]|nr:helix-turn-helix domain-containing protein [Oscillospiraceae bacterium]